jgi:hypothetical protein
VPFLFEHSGTSSETISLCPESSENIPILLQVSDLYFYIQNFIRNPKMGSKQLIIGAPQYTDVRFASFFSGGFITAIEVNPPERRLAKCTSVQYCVL